MKYIDLNSLKFSDIVNGNRNLAKSTDQLRQFNILINGNITINPLKEILEYSLRANSINANVKIGEFDNFIQNTINTQVYDCVVFFWEICNLTPGLYYKSELMSEDEITRLITKTKIEISSALENLKDTSIVLFNKFSTHAFNYTRLKDNKLDRISEELNDFLESLSYTNIHTININKILIERGINDSLTLKHFYSSKNLYSNNFLKSYTQFTLPLILNICGKSNKILVLDCDNTLWNGVVGEVGATGIGFSSENYSTEPYYEVQCLIKSQLQEGVILCLNSKNNINDIEEVFLKNTNMPLRSEDITIKKVNWDNKLKNLIDISTDLNVGIDSIAFIDDSEFEIYSVKEKLTQSTIEIVPKDISQYATHVKRILNTFYQKNITDEDKRKAQIYKEQFSRKNAEKTSLNIDEYLKSLSLKIKYRINSQEDIPRLSQLTLKTNQFNTTTLRYGEGELQNEINKGSLLFSFDLEDKFGDYGTIGFVMIKLQGEAAHINSFLMSCRAIGRTVEFCMFEIILKHLKNLSSIERLTANIIKTQKNSPVQSLYSDLNFFKEITNDYNDSLNFSINLNDYQFKNTHYVEVLNDK